MQNAIHPRLSEVLNGNLGNTLTPELSAGLQGALQQLLNTIAQEAYAAGKADQPSQPEVPAPEPDVVDVAAKN